ncbi:unnamed protein product, partial [Ectocarpus sp. 4 AP-2014]
ERRRGRVRPRQAKPTSKPEPQPRPQRRQPKPEPRQIAPMPEPPPMFPLQLQFPLPGSSAAGAAAALPLTSPLLTQALVSNLSRFPAVAGMATPTSSDLLSFGAAAQSAASVPPAAPPEAVRGSSSAPGTATSPRDPSPVVPAHSLYNHGGIFAHPATASAPASPT